jgi:hypothetical protein
MDYLIMSEVANRRKCRENRWFFSGWSCTWTRARELECTGIVKLRCPIQDPGEAKSDYIVRVTKSMGSGKELAALTMSLLLPVPEVRNDHSNGY